MPGACRGLGGTNAVILVDLDDLAAGSAGDLPELALLIGGRLIDGRDPKVENSAFHDFPLGDDHGAMKVRPNFIVVGSAIFGGNFPYDRKERQSIAENSRTG
jgi:hypothetical protein